MESTEYKYTNLLEKKKNSYNQSQLKDYTNLCVPYSYHIISNQNEVIDKFNFTENNECYVEYMKNILIDVGINKKKNNMHNKQMFLDDAYILNNYNKIYQNCKYNEIILLIDKVDNIIESINSFAIINRANETFPVILFQENKENKFYIFDSHQSYHGIMTKKNLISHITYNDNYY